MSAVDVKSRVDNGTCLNIIPKAILPLGVFRRFFRNVEWLEHLYHWPEPERLPPGCSALNTDLYCSAARWHLTAKSHLSDAWSRAIGAQARPSRFEIAKWVVNEWGGIRRNKRKTIQRYIKQSELVTPPTPFKGISTYSKIYAIAKPQTFAIYDSRVAASLNALQMLEGASSGDRLAFPYRKGRNRTITRFQKRFNLARLERDGWRPIKPAEAYRVYLSVLRLGEKGADAETLQKREMLLFAMADRLCEQALINNNAK
jgi:hypothetical protein